MVNGYWLIRLQTYRREHTSYCTTRPTLVLGDSILHSAQWGRMYIRGLQVPGLGRKYRRAYTNEQLEDRAPNLIEIFHTKHLVIQVPSLHDLVR